MANFKFVYGDNLEFVYVIGLESATATVSALLGIAQRKVKRGMNLSRLLITDETFRQTYFYDDDDTVTADKGVIYGRFLPPDYLFPTSALSTDGTGTPSTPATNGFSAPPNGAGNNGAGTVPPLARQNSGSSVNGTRKRKRDPPTIDVTRDDSEGEGDRRGGGSGGSGDPASARTMAGAAPATTGGYHRHPPGQAANGRSGGRTAPAARTSAIAAAAAAAALVPEPHSAPPMSTYGSRGAPSEAYTYPNAAEGERSGGGSGGNRSGGVANYAGTPLAMQPSMMPSPSQLPTPNNLGGGGGGGGDDSATGHWSSPHVVSDADDRDLLEDLLAGLGRGHGPLGDDHDDGGDGGMLQPGPESMLPAGITPVLAEIAAMQASARGGGSGGGGSGGDHRAAPGSAPATLSHLHVEMETYAGHHQHQYSSPQGAYFNAAPGSGGSGGGGGGGAGDSLPYMLQVRDPNHLGGPVDTRLPPAKRQKVGGDEGGDADGEDGDSGGGTPVPFMPQSHNVEAMIQKRMLQVGDILVFKRNPSLMGTLISGGRVAMNGTNYPSVSAWIETNNLVNGKPKRCTNIYKATLRQDSNKTLDEIRKEYEKKRRREWNQKNGIVDDPQDVSDDDQ